MTTTTTKTNPFPKNAIDYIGKAFEIAQTEEFKTTADLIDSSLTECRVTSYSGGVDTADYELRRIKRRIEMILEDMDDIQYVVRKVRSELSGAREEIIYKLNGGE